MHRIFTILTIGAISFLISSCENSNMPAGGGEDEIYVVADSAEFELLKPALQTVFEKTIYTPQPEKLFTLKRVAPNLIEGNEKKKNIIVLAPLNSNSNTSKLIGALVDSSSENKIKSDKDYIVKKYNLWAKNQLVIFLTAPGMEQLEEKILNNKDNLVSSFQDISDKRLYSSLYNERYEQENVEGKFLKEYGWVIYVQSDFKIGADDAGDKFVWLRKSHKNDMEKWIFIHWIENGSSAYLNEDSIRTIRDRMTSSYYRKGDASGYSSIAKDYYMTSETDFKGRYAICTQGLWELKDKVMNGPFINYTFYDESSKRIYMLDAAVYAPKYYKRNLIQQMDVMLQSFMTANELSKERMQKLLKAAGEDGQK